MFLKQLIQSTTTFARCSVNRVSAAMKKCHCDINERVCLLNEALEDSDQ